MRADTIGADGGITGAYFTVMAADDKLAVSLEPHLLEALVPLQGRVPPDLAAALGPYIVDPPPRTIPYALLHRISQWARTADLSPPLERGAYSMVSLLAGTTTSPESKLGKYVPPLPPDEAAAQQVRDRKAITALFNALLSVGGAAFAAWWAADKTGWRNEWRVLFALAVGTIVALSEALLYIIWQSRATGKLKPLNLEPRRKPARHKRVDAPDEVSIDEQPPPSGDLRKRITQKEDS